MAAVLLIFALGAQPSGTAQEFFRRGVEAVNARDLAKAEQSFRTALELRPDFTPARKNLATVLWFLNRRTESEAEFQKVLTALPEDPVAHLYLGLAEYGRRSAEAAVRHFEKAGELAAGNPEVLPTFVDSLLRAADAYSARNLPEKAYGAYHRAIELDPKSEAPYVAVASFAAAHGNTGFGLEVVAQGLKQVPGSAPMLMEQGILFALEGKAGDAERSFAAAAQADPKSGTAVLALGIAQLQQSRLDEAGATFRRAAAALPKDARCPYLYAYTLNRTGDASRRDEAMAALRRSIELDPRESRAHGLLGQILLSEGRTEEAITELKKAVALDRANQTALYQIALAYRKTGAVGESRRAMAAFQRAKEKSRAEESEAVQVLRTLRPRD